MLRGLARSSDIGFAIRSRCATACCVAGPCSACVSITRIYGGCPAGTLPDMPSALNDDVAALARFGSDGDGVTRLAWTPELRAGYDWLAGRCAELGLTVNVDAAGNLIAKWECGAGPAVLLGSHVDTVPSGGRYDGALGVLAGLHAIRLLKERGVTPRRPVWLAAFMDEENTRFGTALFGSRAFCGESLGGVGERRDRTGVSLSEAMATWNRSLDELGGAAAVDDVGTYLELHIEQGPRLDTDDIDIGVVTSIVGIVGYRVRLDGETNHAGTTPMAHRRDALAGAAAIVLGARDAARSRDSATANVGIIGVEPGGSNVVPGVCSFTLDLRSPTAEGLADLDTAVADLIAHTAATEQLHVTVEETYRIDPAPMEPDLVGAIERCAQLEEATTVRMPSGAGHDAMVLARHVPTAMLFVPSRAGVSHSPAEYTTPEHCDLGAQVLARVVESLVMP